MNNLFWQVQLYTFLLYCNRHASENNMEKNILDCGAGGRVPPLTIFKDYGFDTSGIEIDENQIKRANDFEDKNNINLNIIKGDMRKLPFEKETFSFAYSYNTIFHLNKKEIAESIKEIERVLKTKGLCFVNFVSVDDMRYGEGEEVGNGEYNQKEGESVVLHSYHEYNEADNYFKNFNIIYKERRIREGFTREGEKIQIGFIDYIVEKK